MEERLDPISIRYLEQVGVAPGWDCLEIGAGAGSIARWLAKRVQPEGTVVATDMNTRFLDDIDLPNLTVRQHNMLTDDLEEEQFDLVHSRFVFSHLNSERKCLERMAKALRPGGMILLIDADWSFARTADFEHAEYDLFTRTYELASKAAKKSGMLDPYCGGNLHERLEKIGFADVKSEGITDIHRGGDAFSESYVQGVAIFKPELMATGELSEQDLLRWEALVKDSSFYYLSGLTFAAWGRKPE
jgi:SAM-dependent methyltransferase